MKIPVCIFAKPPVPGRAKTRLGASIGMELAAELATAMLCDTWNTVSSVAGVAPILAASEQGSFPPGLAAAELWLQDEGDLGNRMESIIRRALSHANAAIVLGADSPRLQGMHIQEALSRLKDHDAVIGPTLDGGFYLLGLRSCRIGLLADLPWSTTKTLCETQARLLENNFSINLLPALPDVDIAADVAALIERSSDLVGPATSAWIERHRDRIRRSFVD